MSDVQFPQRLGVQFLVACVHAIFPSFRFQWLADEIRRNLPNELDFRCEARNQEKFSALFKHLTFVKVSLGHMLDAVLPSLYIGTSGQLGTDYLSPPHHGIL